jgi:hypothetical protein
MNAEDIAAGALANLESSSKLNSKQPNQENLEGDKKLTKKNGGAKDAASNEPRVIQVVKKPRAFMNHSYRDFSSVVACGNDEVPTSIEAMSFPQKVHHMLSQPESEKWIRWMPHGRAFLVVVPKMLESKILPKYFGHSRYSSFLRQLSNHGFKHISQGPDRNCHYHEVSK